MKKILFFAAAAVAMLTGCSQNDDLTAPTVAQNDQQTPVEFGTYMGYSGQTRAGSTGDIVDYNATSGHTLGSAGYEFGVFAYLTGTTYPNVAASAPAAVGDIIENTNKPNFMFNQKVDYNTTTTGAWGYSPLKYWPNGEVSSTDNNADNANATSTSLNYLSFFAYAPYVTKTAANGTGTGITGMSDNNAQGNPTITYKMAANQANVDLLWGTYNGGEGYEVVHGSDKQTGGKVWGTEAGTPATVKNYGVTNVNLTKQQKDQKVKFLFKHALAKIAGGSAEKNSKMGLMIKVDPDEGANFGDNASAENRQTVVTVKEITIKNNDTKTGDNYNAEKEKVGILDLATGIWSHPVPKTQDLFSQTIKPSTGDWITINPEIEERTTISDPVTDGNWTTYLEIDGTTIKHPGVTKTARPVYATEQSPLLYFPGEIPSLEVEIEYVVRTKDPNLELGYSVVTQKIKKTVTFASAVEMNKYYGLTIILGLTSVKFEATVSDWDKAGTTDDDEDGTNETTPVYLPINVQ